MTPRSLPAALGAALLLTTGMAHAALGTTDTVGDFVSTFTGTKGGDLDVVSTFATYDAATNVFHISGTFAANVGTTPDAIYVFGFDRGLGTERFAAAGYAGIVFDSVVTLLPNSTGTVSTLAGAAGGGALTSANVHVSGNTISADFSGTLLPTNGMALGKYTFNLWPRQTSAVGGGVAPISDFAPDGANITIAAVPEPGTYALFGAGLGVVALLRRRSRARE